MNNYVSILAILKQTYTEKFGSTPEISATFSNPTFIDKLMHSVMYVINALIGFRSNGDYELSRIKYLFNNIIENINDYNPGNLPNEIDKYLHNLNSVLDAHPNVDMLLKVFQRVYSPDYDGKPGNYNSETIESRQKQYIRLRDNYLEFGLINRREDNNLPIIRIPDIDELEDILSDYFIEVFTSDSYYNAMKRDGFDYFDPDSIKMMLLEGTILNSSYKDTLDIAQIFKRYIQFVRCEGLAPLKNRKGFQLGENLDAGMRPVTNYLPEDQIYKLQVFLKRSDVEYESPYYISIFLYNEKHIIELPNVRLGVTKDEEGKEKGYILATQTSQSNMGSIYFPKEDYDLQGQVIKENIPRTSKYRYFNPNHLISLLITFGILKGLGIENTEVVKKMPIRVYKTICDKGYNTDEANKYILRINEKNVCTYQKLGAIIPGINVNASGDVSDNIEISVSDKLTFPNEYLESLYGMGLELGTKLREEKPTLN